MGEMTGYAWRELRRRKWRTATTVLGYFLAVGVTVGLLSAMSSRRQADRVLSGTGTHFVAFVPADAAPGAAPPLAYIDPENEGLIAVGNNEVATSLLPEDLVASVQELATVKDASGALLFRFRDPADGHAFTVAGVDAKNKQAVGTTCCASTDVLRGSFLDPKARRGAMVEEAYAKAHQIDVGHKVAVAGTPFNVVGIVNSGIRPVKADIYMPYTEAEEQVNSRMKGRQLQHRFNALLVEVLNSQVQDKAMKDVKALDSNLVVSTYACYRPAAQVMGMNETAIRVLVVLVAIGVFLFAAKSQFASVAERRGDIGVLKAIGWSGRQVATLLLAESVIQGLIGGLLGGFAAAIGLAISEAGVPRDVTTGSADDLVMIGGVLGSGLLLALLGGILAGLAPALVSVRISPAEAIRKL
jgi:ABC-type antimicrobial peptide transport system permease subunit